ncbi:MAG: glycoside hydrolase family 32 protein [Candidatus Bathyarchaeota archaeon]
MTDHEKVERLKQQIESETLEELTTRLAKAAKDPDRPRYHYQPPPSWMNDPCGPFFWKGKYHMFYQYNPDKPYRATNMHWGHAVSKDLVHWTHLPIALTPTPSGPDKDGCFTGCMVNHDGIPTIIYTGVWPEVQCVATSTDSMITWQKYKSNPVISAPPASLTVTGFRDPCSWKEGDTWYMIIGSGIKDVGGTSLLYKSRDLIQWEYVHPLYECDSAHPMHECPDFFPLGNKYVLLTSTDFDSTHWDVGTYADHKFMLERHGKIDWGKYYAAKTMKDDRGRRIIWGWIVEGRSVEKQIKAGWSGVLSLPRILTLLPDNTLCIKPAPELEALRGNRWSFRDIELLPSDKLPLDEVQGDCIEIIAKFASNDAKTFGIVIQGTNTIAYDREKHQIAGAPLDLASGEDLNLHIYVDRSVIEIFANDRVCKTLRTYHRPGDKLGVSVFADGDNTKLKSIDIYEMKSIISLSPAPKIPSIPPDLLGHLPPAPSTPFFYSPSQRIASSLSRSTLRGLSSFRARRFAL